MKKTNTPSHLDAQFQLYSALSKGIIPTKATTPVLALGSAFLLGLPMTGMTQTYCYHSLNLTVMNGQDYNFDFDGNGEIEMTLRVRNSPPDAPFMDLNKDKPNFDGFFFNTAGRVYIPVLPLNYARTVNQLATAAQIPFRTFDFFLNGNGQWVNGANPVSGYAIFRFTSDTGTSHLGWMYLTVYNPGDPGASPRAIIRDYAVNIIPVGMAGGNSVTTGAGLGNATACSVLLPVEMSHFKAKPGEESIALSWRTETEKDNAGFEVQRSTDGRQFQSLKFVAGAGTTTEAHDYAFEDKTVRKGQHYFYRLKQIDQAGTSTYSDLVQAALPGGKLAVESISPNPAVSNGSVLLRLQLPQESDVLVTLFDARGIAVRTQRQTLAEGAQSLSLSVNGLSGGAYFVKTEANGESVYQKLMVGR